MATGRPQSSYNRLTLHMEGTTRFTIWVGRFVLKITGTDIAKRSGCLLQATFGLMADFLLISLQDDGSRCSQAAPPKSQTSAKYSSLAADLLRRTRRSLSGSNIPAFSQSGKCNRSGGRSRSRATRRILGWGVARNRE